MNQYGFFAYVITVACVIAGVSIFLKSEVGLGFAGGISTGAFGALQSDKKGGS